MASLTKMETFLKLNQYGISLQMFEITCQHKFGMKQNRMWQILENVEQTKIYYEDVVEIYIAQN